MVLLLAPYPVPPIFLSRLILWAAFRCNILDMFTQWYGPNMIFFILWWELKRISGPFQTTLFSLTNFVMRIEHVLFSSLIQCTVSFNDSPDWPIKMLSLKVARWLDNYLCLHKKVFSFVNENRVVWIGPHRASLGKSLQRWLLDKNTVFMGCLQEGHPVIKSCYNASIGKPRLPLLTGKKAI